MFGPARPFGALEYVVGCFRLPPIDGYSEFSKAILGQIPNTVNPQKIVRLSFLTLVFLVRLSFEVFCKILRLDKNLLLQTKDLDTRIPKMA